MTPAIVWLHSWTPCVSLHVNSLCVTLHYLQIASVQWRKIRLHELLTFSSQCNLSSGLGLIFPSVLSFADRKKIREINPDEEKLSEAGGGGGGGGERRDENPDMIPIANSTSSSNMALISNALAAYNYISGKITHHMTSVTSRLVKRLLSDLQLNPRIPKNNPAPPKCQLFISKGCIISK